MRLFLLLPLFPVLCFTACKSHTKAEENSVPTTQANKAQVFSESLFDLEQTLEEPMLKAEAEITVRQQRGNFEGMAQSALAMEDSLDRRIGIIKKMPAGGKGRRGV